jgi:RecA-superfamily ATPases implicated in signal transduction
MSDDRRILARADAITDTFDQTHEADQALNRPASAYLHLPFGAVDGLVGGIAPGDVWFVAAFSGNGKTSLLMSLVLRLLQAGRTVFYMGLESRPHILRTQLACLRLGYDVGEVLSGAAKGWGKWDAIKAELITDIQQQRALKPGYKFLVDGQAAIHADGLAPALHQAALSSADLVIIDHIDHLQLGDGGSIYDQSRKVTHLLLRLAHEYQLRLLIATQLNNEAAKGDRLAIYQPPQPHHVYMGAHKRMIATGMLGLFRPTRTGLTKEETNAVRAGTAEPHTILEPNTMGVVCMKHRYYGQREGHRAVLHVERGKVDDMAERDRYSTSYGQQP